MVDPVDALEQVATALELRGEDRHRSLAFRRAAEVLRGIAPEEVRALAASGGLVRLPGIGKSTARVVDEALAGNVPEYLQRLGAEPSEVGAGAAALRAALRGDLHAHSTWSDGSAEIEVMARGALDQGHEYLACTDHSPRLQVAHGLTRDRLLAQIDAVAEVNDSLPDGFRVLAGIEVDILDDGSLDQDDDVLGALDVVVASVHSKMRMDAAEMTERLVRAVSHPHTDVLGHCTGRLVAGRGRPESVFDAARVFEACAAHRTAVEVNCRPERLDPPMRLLREAVDAGCLLSIDSDAHAVGQLGWQTYGCARVAQIAPSFESIVNTWPVERLLEWSRS